MMIAVFVQLRKIPVVIHSDRRNFQIPVVFQKAQHTVQQPGIILPFRYRLMTEQQAAGAQFFTNEGHVLRVGKFLEIERLGAALLLGQVVGLQMQPVIATVIVHAAVGMLLQLLPGVAQHTGTGIGQVQMP